MFYLTTHSTRFIYGYMASNSNDDDDDNDDKETRCGWRFFMAVTFIFYLRQKVIEFEYIFNSKKKTKTKKNYHPFNVILVCI